MEKKLDAPVVFAPCEDYREPDLSKALLSLLEPLGGIQSFVSPGERILLKPNILAGRASDRAVTTHPLLVASVVKACVEVGAEVIVGDSPGLESLKRAAGVSGIFAAAESAGAAMVSFGPEKTKISPTLPDGKYRSFEVAKILDDVDGVINLAKLKTHGQMALSLGVKNTFGCIPGLEKAQWHLKAGSSETFAGMLLELHSAVDPRLTLIDGIVAMEGNGPFSGDPRATGFLCASRDARACDLAVARYLGFYEEDVQTLLAPGFEHRNLALELLSSLSRHGLSGPSFEPASKFHHIAWLPFAPLRRFFRKSFTPSPKIDSDRCIACYRCVDICPAKAIRPSRPAEVPELSMDKCIRCFCCQEICPEGAISVECGLLLKIFGKFF